MVSGFDLVHLPDQRSIDVDPEADTISYIYISVP